MKAKKAPIKNDEDKKFSLYEIATKRHIADGKDFASVSRIAAEEFAKNWGLPPLKNDRYYLQWNKEILRDSDYSRVADEASGTYRIVTNFI